MKINRIEVSNVLGARDVCVDTIRPICVFAGPNGNGKTSILEAVRMAFIGQPARGVNLKKNYAQLISDGATTGQASVTTDQGELWMMLPTGKGAHASDKPALPFVLDQSRMAALTDKERKTAILEILGLKQTTDVVKARMKAMNLDMAKAERVLPLLRAGFEEAAKHAAEQATQAKGAWKLITGEQWGSEKGGSWTAQPPVFNAERLQSLTDEMTELEQKIAKANQDLGSLRTKRQQAVDYAGLRETLRAKVDLIPRLQAKLKFDEAELVKAKESLANCPGEKRLGLIHELGWALSFMVFYGDALDMANENDQRVKAALDAYEVEHGKVSLTPHTIDQDRVPAIKASVNLLTNSVNNCKRDLAEAEEAKAKLETLNDLNAEVKESDLQDASARLAALTTSRASVETAIAGLRSAKLAAETAEANTKKAAETHSTVMQWLAIADAMGPKGIPGQMASEGLKPLRDRLTQSAEDSGWPRVDFTDEMGITYGGRAYALLSESEKWRADAMLSEAISNVSGLKLLVLDRFDVLDLPGRSQAIAWLDTLAINNEINTVLLAATLKSAAGTWPETFSTHWVSRGLCAQREMAEAA